MPIRHAIWKVSETPQQLTEAALASEQLLETMILKSPDILSSEWMLIGQQEITGAGGRLDLLAVAPDGALVLIELKRNRTPREVVAQALDYASWVEKLEPEEIAGIYGRFSKGRSLSDDFRARFGVPLDEDTLNESHQIVIVAASLDDSTTPNSPKEPWNGEFYACFGHESAGRPWNEATKYGFLSAGGGSWYTNTLNLLKPGDRVWTKAPGFGFVGVGRVKGQPQPAASFKITTPEGERLAMDVLKGNYHREFIDDPERSEYFVPIEWLDTKPIEEAINEIGLFGNQNTVCKPITPKWRHTIEVLKKRLPGFSKA